MKWVFPRIVLNLDGGGGGWFFAESMSQVIILEIPQKLSGAGYFQYYVYVWS